MHVLTLIGSAVIPCMYSKTVHFIVTPFTLIFPAITPAVLTISMYVVLMPLPSVVTAIRPQVYSFPLLLPFIVLALVLSSIRPCFHALTALQVVQPIPLMHGSTAVQVYSKPISLVIQPLALKAISIFKLNSPLAVNFVALPLALIGAPVGECLIALSLSLSVHPLPRISASRLERYCGQFFFILSLHFCLDQFKQCVFLKRPWLLLNSSPAWSHLYLLKQGCFCYALAICVALKRSLGFQATKFSQKLRQLLSLPITFYKELRGVLLECFLAYFKRREWWYL